MCLAEFKGFAQLCLCRRVGIRNFVFPAFVTAFSPRALLGFGVFKLRRVLVRKVPILLVGCGPLEFPLPEVLEGSQTSTEQRVGPLSPPQIA